MANIRFIKIASAEKVVEELVKKLSQRLSKGQGVVWLIAGGSAMDIAVKTAAKLKGLANISKLTISLTDERYGPVGNRDSNWQQLSERGFSLPGACLLPVLSGISLEAEAQRYSKMLNGEISKAGYSLALAGMGPDGHIFGIKPHSPAVNSQKDVVAYAWDDYQRLTLTFNLIKKLKEVIIYAAGEEKHGQLDDLEKNLSPADQPAQLLKDLRSVTIFNDYKGEVA